MLCWHSGQQTIFDLGKMQGVPHCGSSLILRRSLLSTYRKNLSTSLSVLKALQRSSLEPFSNMTSGTVITRGRAPERLMELYSGHVEPLALDYAAQLTDSHLGLTQHMDLVLLTLFNYSRTPNPSTCAICAGTILDMQVVGTQDPSGEYFARQNRLIEHLDAAPHSTKGLVPEKQLLGIELGRYMSACERLSREVTALFTALKPRHNADFAYGLWHPAKIGELAFHHPVHRAMTDSLQQTTLHYYLRNATRASVETMLSLDVMPGTLGDYINQQDILGCSPLHIVAQNGWDIAVQACLQRHGAEPGQTTIYGSLPLHYAAAKCYKGIVKTLLEHKHKYNLNQLDCKGKTALHYATEEGHLAVAQMIDKSMADGGHLSAP